MRMVWHDPMGRHGQSPLMIEARDGGDKICKRAAHIYMREAKSVAPVGQQTRTAGVTAGGKSWGERSPGKLRDSIRVSKSKYKDGGWLVIIGGRDTYYWTFLEWGAWHIPATNKHRNFMLKAFKRVGPMMGSQRGAGRMTGGGGRG